MVGDPIDAKFLAQVSWVLLKILASTCGSGIRLRQYSTCQISYLFTQLCWPFPQKKSIWVCTERRTTDDLPPYITRPRPPTQRRNIDRSEQVVLVQHQPPRNLPEIVDPTLQSRHGSAARDLNIFLWVLRREYEFLLLGGRIDILRTHFDVIFLTCWACQSNGLYRQLSTKQHVQLDIPPPAGCVSQLGRTPALCTSGRLLCSPMRSGNN